MINIAVAAFTSVALMANAQTSDMSSTTNLPDGYDRDAAIESLVSQGWYGETRLTVEEQERVTDLLRAEADTVTDFDLKLSTLIALQDEGELKYGIRSDYSTYTHIAYFHDVMKPNMTEEEINRFEFTQDYVSQHYPEHMDSLFRKAEDLEASDGLTGRHYRVTLSGEVIDGKPLNESIVDTFFETVQWSQNRALEYQCLDEDPDAMPFSRAPQLSPEDCDRAESIYTRLDTVSPFTPR